MEPSHKYDILGDGSLEVALCEDWSEWTGRTRTLIVATVTYGIVILNLVVRFIFIGLAEFMGFMSETEKFDFIRKFVYWAVFF
jgi:hypothetical protein